jgi:hypothetical protein
MESLMSLQKYVRQLRPIQESYVDHVDRVQTLLTESKTTQDLVEKTISVEFNRLKEHSDPIKAANLDETDYKSIKPEFVETGVKVAKNLVSEYPAIKVLKHFGRKGDEKENQYKTLYPELNVKNATAKTDIGDGGKFSLSLKEAGGAQLMSPKGAESTGLVRSAIDRCSNTGVKIVGDGSKALALLSETLDTLSVKQMYITVGGKKEKGAKDSFIEWYLVYRTNELKRDINFKKATKANQERHMKAELSVFKITNQDKKYKDKLIKNVKPLKNIKPYFKAYTKDKGVDIGKYRIPDSYFKSNKEKDLGYDNEFMRNKVVEILDVAIKQTKFLDDLSEEFTQNKELAEYIVYEAATGLAKFTGDVEQVPPYKGSDNFVAKYMMTYDKNSGALAPLEDCWSWAKNNSSSLTSGLKIDFKSSRTSRAGYTKFAIGIAKKVLNMNYFYEPKEHDAMSEMFDEEYAKISPTLYQYEKEMDMLNEGLLDYVKKGYRSVVDAMSKIKQKVVEVLIKFLKKIFTKIVEYIKQLFNSSINLALNFLEVDVNTGSFKIVNNV